jgi:sigma-B regulation protein RsbU (phosphoserine phosphatase)
VIRAPGPSRLADFFETYTKDLTADDLQRLFTRDAREAYKFFTRGVDVDALKRMPWHKRAITEARILFFAFSMKLSPARRVVFSASLLLAIIGLVNLFRGIGIVEIARMPFLGGIWVPGPLFSQGTWSLLFALALMNLLVLLEVADRLSLKNDLEVARDIQQAMLPSGLYSAPGVETFGMSRPANTVGGDFYDILPLDDGRLVVATSPAKAVLLRCSWRCCSRCCARWSTKSSSLRIWSRGSTYRSAATRRARGSSRCFTGSISR